MKLFELCSSCERSLNDLAARNGGIIFCPHEVAGNSQSGGVLITIIPGIEDGDRAQLRIVFPATGAEVKEHQREIIFEMGGGPGVRIQ